MPSSSVVNYFDVPNVIKDKGYFLNEDIKPRTVKLVQNRHSSYSFHPTLYWIVPTHFDLYHNANIGHIWK